MKLIDSKLYIEFADFLAAGWPEKTIKSANHRNGSNWMMIQDPKDKRKPLVEYESLRTEHKKKLIAHFGDVYEYIAKEPIRMMVQPDIKAEEYYLTYRYDANKALTPEHVNKYTKAACWLNMLKEVTQSKKVLKKELNLTIDQFWMHVINIIRAENIDLPTSYQRLITKVKEYAEKGYECLIDWRFGNKLAAKINDEISESILLELIAHPNQHDDFIICRAYNEWATKKGYKTIDPATVGHHRRKNNHLVQSQREGNGAWYNTYGKIIHRQRPSAPLLLVGSDDNHLDMFFTDYFRYKLILVMDAYNDYILGYSYGDTINTDMVRAAYLDAMHHIRQLTGGWYLPHQTQTDRFGFTNLEPFYKSFSIYTPATAKVARAKYIEQAFGHHWHTILKMYPNYSGHNITAKSKTNPDNPALNKKNFPAVSEGGAYIEDFINKMRQLPSRKTGVPRQQEWLDAFNASEKSRERKISDEKMLATFGFAHTHTNTITNGGLRLAIDGNIYRYEVPNELYLQNVGKTVQVIYDPYDLSRVLVTDGGSTRFIATEFKPMKSAIADYEPGDRIRLNNMLAEKRKHVESISMQKERRREIIELNKIDAESLLQANVMVKEIRQRAELEYYRNDDDNEDSTLAALEQM